MWAVARRRYGIVWPDDGRCGRHGEDDEEPSECSPFHYAFSGAIGDGDCRLGGSGPSVSRLFR